MGIRHAGTEETVLGFPAFLIPPFSFQQPYETSERDHLVIRLNEKSMNVRLEGWRRRWRRHRCRRL